VLYLNYKLEQLLQRTIIFLGLILWGVCVLSKKNDDIYQITLSVASKNKNDFNQVVSQGFKRILERLIPHKHQRLLKDIEAPTFFLDSYSYLKVKGNQQQLMKITYSEPLIKNMLNNKKIPFIANVRPVTLALISITSNNQSVLLGQEEAQRLGGQKLLLEAVREYHLPIIFPLLDLVDLQTLSAQPILKLCNDKQTIEQLLRRYHTAHGICGNLYHGDNSTWLGNIVIKMNGINKKVELEASSLAKIMFKISQLIKASILEEMFVEHNQLESNSMILNVKNVLTEFDYFDTIKALKTLPQVKQVDLIAIDKNNLQYKLEFSGEKNKLLYSIDSSRYFLINKKKKQAPIVYLRYIP